MKRILLFLLLSVLFLSACSTLKKGKAAGNTYEGEYIKSLNTFTYKKDNLVFKDKKLSYTVIDESGTLDLIYDSIGSNYEVTDNDIVTLKVSGTVSNGILTIKRVLNYRIPEYKLNNQTLELQ